MELLETPAGLEQFDRLERFAHVVHSEHVDAGCGKSHGDAEGGRHPVGLLVAKQMTDEAFSRVSHQQRATDVEKSMDLAYQRQVVFMRLPESDSRIEANSLLWDLKVQAKLQSSEQVPVDLLHHDFLTGIILHGLRRAPHMHHADADAAFDR